MNSNDNSLTISSFVNDTKHDSADVLSLLQVIEQLYIASRRVINSHSAVAILLSMSVELQTLLIKLQAMHRRWSVHLPFKEASTVEFPMWSSKAAQMAEIIAKGDCRYCMDADNDIPSCHCLVDLYDQAIRQSADTTGADAPEIETDAMQMLNRRSKTQEALRGCREQCVEAITQMVTSRIFANHPLDLTTLGDLQKARTVSSSLLIELSGLLQQMHDQLVKYINAQDYERLADRILFEAEYEGQDARREAREAVVNWRNGVPVKNLESERLAQIEKVKEAIRKTRHGVKLEQYVDLDDDFQKQRSEFGRFLFNRRREISREELRQLILLVYSVYYYQQDMHQAIGSTDSVAPDLSNIPSDITDSIPDFPPLPADFCAQLRNSQAATMRFYRILFRVEPFVNSGKPKDCTEEQLAHYKDWTWCYLQTAFEQLGFLPKGSNKTNLARFIHTVFPHRSEGSVNRSLCRNTNPNSHNIVSDIVKEFQPVTELWK